MVDNYESDDKACDAGCQKSGDINRNGRLEGGFHCQMQGKEDNVH